MMTPPTRTPRSAVSAPGRARARLARALLRGGAALALALALTACDKCGRLTPVNKPWSTACESGPAQR
ncbi:hypothetical protein ACFFJB_04140 [Camelimonas abortus]|uniref:Peptidylprolyl isomerase n=1 Tax=Camelimonas abortus TaxID=1017184 RepID=A0ABV7LD88_9HYPH